MESAVLTMARLLRAAGVQVRVDTAVCSLPDAGESIRQGVDLSEKLTDLPPGSLVVDNGLYMRLRHVNARTVAVLHSVVREVPGPDVAPLPDFARALACYDGVLAVSDFVARQVQGMCSIPARSFVLAVDEVYSSVDAGGHHAGVLFPHRLVEYKSIDVLLRAMALLPGLSWTFVDLDDGFGQRAAWRERLSAIPGVRLVPATANKAEMALLYSSHSVMVQPSLREALGKPGWG